MDFNEPDLKNSNLSPISVDEKDIGLKELLDKSIHIGGEREMVPRPPPTPEHI